MIRASILLLAALLAPTFQSVAQSSVPWLPMATHVRDVSLNTASPKYIAIVYVGTNKFTFEMPPGFSLNGDPANGKLGINCVEMGAYISFKIAAPGTGLPGLNAATVAAEYSDGVLMDQFDRPVLGANCRVFDIEWKAPSRMILKRRVLHVPTAAGILEISLTSGEQQFQGSATRFDWFLNSLRLNANEKQLLAPRPLTS